MSYDPIRTALHRFGGYICSTGLMRLISALSLNGHHFKTRGVCSTHSNQENETLSRVCVEVLWLDSINIALFGELAISLHVIFYREIGAEPKV